MEDAVRLNRFFSSEICSPGEVEESALNVPERPERNDWLNTVEAMRLRAYPEWKIVVDKNLRIPVADETTFMLPEAGYEYQKISGQGMKKYVKEHLSLLRGMTQDQAQESLTRASEEIFASARSRIRAKYPKALRQRK